MTACVWPMMISFLAGVTVVVVGIIGTLILFIRSVKNEA